MGEKIWLWLLLHGMGQNQFREIRGTSQREDLSSESLHRSVWSCLEAPKTVKRLSCPVIELERPWDKEFEPPASPL